jgi:hypothetical protein
MVYHNTGQRAAQAMEIEASLDRDTMEEDRKQNAMEMEASLNRDTVAEDSMQ